MLQRIIILFSIFYISFATSAQWRYGLQLGGNIQDGKTSGTSDVRISDKSGFDGGIIFEYQIPKTGFAPDIALTWNRHNADIMASGEKYRLPVNYISVPLHIKYKIAAGILNNVIEPMIYTGPQCNLRLSDNVETFPIDKFTVNWDAGIGFDIINFIQLTGGYSFGLNNAMRNTSLMSLRYKMNYWYIGVNILFDF